MKIYSRKVTISFCLLLALPWVSLAITIFVAAVLNPPKEFLIITYLLTFCLIFLVGVSGLFVWFLGYIPLELPLAPLYAIPLSIIGWGLPPAVAALPFTLAFGLNFLLIAWYLHPITREKSGIFQ